MDRQQRWIMDTEKNLSLPEITISDSTFSLSDNYPYPYDLSITNTMDTITINSGTGTNGSVLGSNGLSTASWQSTTPMTVEQSGTIRLQGDNADIIVNGESLMETLKALQERLNVLRPNVELEKEWDQLRELGEQYRKLESELKEKTKMWDTLKKMPPPQID